ncbi:MAG: hypothetical protein IT285_04140 [Bdellovibrionales bacterium]|nr:hypothetical protein [Bdellovibrionales bacterium]
MEGSRTGWILGTTALAALSLALLSAMITLSTARAEDEVPTAFGLMPDPTQSAPVAAPAVKTLMLRAGTGLMLHVSMPARESYLLVRAERGEGNPRAEVDVEHETGAQCQVAAVMTSRDGRWDDLLISFTPDHSIAGYAACELLVRSGGRMNLLDLSARI